MPRFTLAVMYVRWQVCLKHSKYEMFETKYIVVVALSSNKNAQHVDSETDMLRQQENAGTLAERPNKSQCTCP
jgi:hypothetical protein